MNVLLAHQIADSDPDHCAIRPRTFDALLARIFKLGARTIDLASAQDASLSLTFDDGRASDYSIAFPRLKERGWSATFFLIVSKVETPGYITWAQAREMADAGMEIGSHSLTHVFLSKSSDAEVKRELEVSKSILQDRLGRSVESFAVPGGEYDGRTLQAGAAAGYRRVCISEPGINPSAAAPVLRRNALTRWTPPDGLDSLIQPTPADRLRWKISHGARSIVKRTLGPDAYIRLREAFLR